MADYWQQIDDDGVVMDWTTLDMPDLWHPLNALRRALNERQLATGTIQTGAIDRLSSIYDSCLAIHNAISVQIPLFVNHTDSGGDWSGKTEIPAWTEATILAAMGDTSRIPISRLGVNNDWMAQSYNALNLLRWRFPTLTEGGSMQRGANAEALSQNDIVAAITSAYGSAEWGNYISPGFPPFGAQFRIYRGTINDWSGGIYNVRFRFKCVTYSTENIQSSMDAYLKGRLDGAPYFGTNIYGNSSPYLQNNGSYNKYPNILLSGYGVSNLRQVDWIQLNDPTEYEIPTEDYHSNNVGCWCDIYKVVEKFDGPNGFKFKDW